MEINNIMYVHKGTYKAPQMEIIKLDFQQIICTSELDLHDDSEEVNVQW
jgi:hypothetical protein